MKNVKATPEQLKDIETKMWNEWTTWWTDEREDAYDAWALTLTRERAQEILDGFIKEEYELGEDDDPQLAEELWREIGWPTDMRR